MKLNEKLELELKLASWMSKLREEKGLSQEALGTQLSKGQSDIAKIEGGNKRISVIEFLEWLSVLDVSFERVNEGLYPIYTKLSMKKSLWKPENE